MYSDDLSACMPIWDSQAESQGEEEDDSECGSGEGGDGSEHPAAGGAAVEGACPAARLLSMGAVR